MLAKILRARLRDEGEEREAHAALGIALFGFGAQLRDAGEVDFKKARHVRGDAPRHHHVVGGNLANLGPWLDPVPWPWFDDGMLDGNTVRRAWCVVRGLPGWRTFDVAENILLRYATGITAAGNP